MPPRLVLILGNPGIHEDACFAAVPGLGEAIVPGSGRGLNGLSGPGREAARQHQHPVPLKGNTFPFRLSVVVCETRDTVDGSGVSACRSSPVSRACKFCFVPPLSTYGV